ncbi:DegT/DnrJ/EryC1/StrS family aminotransferase [Aestuariivirga sp.]|uniref:DegT/DnrJ/EryC1/StrS family aminotransferase n=1 Tax=Aestuariivirga sp. TaxID=2650926 RepID=UPI0035944AF8
MKSIKYPFLDVRFTYSELKEQIDAAYHQVMDSGIYIGGSAMSDFEAAFASYCGAKHCIGVGNGLEALVMPLRACGIGPGDEVIVPANTFIATWLAVSQVGADIVPIDADPDTMNIDLSKVEAAISPRTKAIMPVHLYGAPVHMASLRSLAAAHGLLLIEDAAQAHGARDQNIRTGMLGEVAGFSFYPGKNLGAFGDGGAVVTNDDDMAKAVRKIANYGSEIKYQHDTQGGNSRLDPLQAAFLKVKLARIDAWNAQRKEIAQIYFSQLADVSALRLPKVAPGTDPVWHLFVVRHDRRDALRDALVAEGVGVAMHYPIANHLSGAYRDQYGHLSFPVTEEICRTCLSLPIGPHLAAHEAREIAAILRRVVWSI